ncbi:alkaline phosphatase family protein [Sphingobacterium thalpophilum]|uniref:Type I phosphodiesterase / nucleotide pyrophosphatase n=1 Tax=Sphingobacterium thalpophilum TaxID=259 RepID=A0A4U9UUW9_9SPHI|nr:alkaline phosphatase family protein [Sphingobacterium thalpophilum]VTR33864.1 Type I phosphodiesterase / nucleotide pyrophosphatase [Sphingobacterium thalpophilum]
MKIIFINIKKILLFVMWAVCLVSCTKYANPPAIYEDYEQNLQQPVKRKILFISIDGLVGQELKKNVPVNIGELLKTSKYTFNALADENTSNPSSWMTMMSGVTYSNHHIIDESYIPRPNEDDPHGNVAGYPSMLYRIATVAPSLKTTVVSRSATLNDKLLVSANETYTGSSDEEVKSKVLNLFDTKNTDFMIVQFTSVLEAGEKGGFTADNSDYINAIKKVDGYIGEIHKGLTGRRNYQNEDWLVILTSNHGGIGNSYGGGSSQERNTFAIFQNKNFKGAELTGRPMSYVRMWGYDGTGNKPLGVRAVSDNIGNASDYDVATTKELTISARLRFNLNNTIISSTYQPNTYNYWYSGIFGKDSNTSLATPGWMYYTWGNDLQVKISDGVKEATCQTAKINGEWYTMTTVIKAIGNDQINIKIYNNGTLAQETTTSGMNVANIKTNDPLIFGYRPNISYDLVDFDVSNVSIFNKAFTQEEIRNSLCFEGELTQSSVANSLKGYWKMSPDQIGVIKNEISGKSAMGLTGDFYARMTSEVIPCELGDNAVFVQAADFFPQIFYWLEVRTLKDWKLEGQVFLNRYEVEFLMPKQ